jgi:hypothetical protein
MNKRFKGTVGWTKEGGLTTWRAIVRDTETNNIVEEAIVKSKDIDGAVIIAKTMAKEWEKAHD